MFTDYNKAFDLIDHKILLSKLKHFGVAAKELSLFENYLKDRYQFVHLNGKGSIYKMIEYSVPQGSILGPLLLLVTINDLPRVVTNSLVDVYADDTTLSASASITNPSLIQNHFQIDQNQVINWSVNNKMILNSSKTKALLVTGKRLESKLNLYPLNLTAHGNSTNEIKSGILLGVTIDSNLNFNDHIDTLFKKVS